MPNKQGKSSSAAEKRRQRAERIVRATGAYSEEFRARVQQALDADPSKLAELLREADEDDQLRASVGRSVYADMRKGGLPLGESDRDITGPNRPLNRSRKHTTLTLAERIEWLLVENKNGRLNEDGEARAQLIDDILYDVSSTTQITPCHPKLVRSYVLAIFDKLNDLDQHGYESVQRAFAAIRDLTNLCSDARFEEIDRHWNSHCYKDEAPYYKTEQAPVEVTIPESAELIALREKLTNLERLPENEAVAFDLETKIYQLERAAVIANDWPDIIGGTNGN